MTETPNPFDPSDITLDDAQLDDLEADIRLAMADLDWDARRAVAEVVSDSDHVQEDEMAAVAVEMYDRIVGNHR